MYVFLYIHIRNDNLLAKKVVWFFVSFAFDLSASLEAEEGDPHLTWLENS